MRPNKNSASGLGFDCSESAQSSDISKIQTIIDSLEDAISLTYAINDLAESIIPVMACSKATENKESGPPSKFTKAYALSRILNDRVRASYPVLNRMQKDLAG